MAPATQALRVLETAGASFKVHEYEIARNTDADQVDLSYGEEVALALGVDPKRLFKTLIAICNARPAVAIVPVAAQLSLKALAKAAGAKKAQMADANDAEKWTGYVVGGISPLGQKRRMPTFIDQSATAFDTIFVSAGQRGLQVEISPVDLIRLLDIRPAPLAE